MGSAPGLLRCLQSGAGSAVCCLLFKQTRELLTWAMGEENPQLHPCVSLSFFSSKSVPRNSAHILLHFLLTHYQHFASQPSWEQCAVPKLRVTRRALGSAPARGHFAPTLQPSSPLSAQVVFATFAARARSSAPAQPLPLHPIKSSNDLCTCCRNLPSVVTQVLPLSPSDRHAPTAVTAGLQKISYHTATNLSDSPTPTCALPNPTSCPGVWWNTRACCVGWVSFQEEVFIQKSAFNCFWRNIMQWSARQGQHVLGELLPAVSCAVSDVLQGREHCC